MSTSRRSSSPPGLADHFEASGDTADLTAVRAAQALIQTLRGKADRVAGMLDWLETASRDTGSVEYIIGSLATAAFAHSTLAHPDRAAALLTEIHSTPGNHTTPYYAARLPLMVRTALTLGDPQLAERLAEGVEPHTPYHQNALTTATAALAEARGDLDAAAHGYADATNRWQSLGALTEQAFALLGRGRTLVAQGHHMTAIQPLREARDIFARLQAAPALEETESLLQHATSLGS